MMGGDSEPGIVPHAIAEVFRTIARTPGKEFLLRLSMMEIYNEVGGNHKRVGVVWVLAGGGWGLAGGYWQAGVLSMREIYNEVGGG